MSSRGLNVTRQLWLLSVLVSVVVGVLGLWVLSGWLVGVFGVGVVCVLGGGLLSGGLSVLVWLLVGGVWLVGGCVVLSVLLVGPVLLVGVVGVLSGVSWGVLWGLVRGLFVRVGLLLWLSVVGWFGFVWLLGGLWGWLGVVLRVLVGVWLGSWVLLWVVWLCCGVVSGGGWLFVRGGRRVLGVVVSVGLLGGLVGFVPVGVVGVSVPVGVFPVFPVGPVVVSGLPVDDEADGVGGGVLLREPLPVVVESPVVGVPVDAGDGWVTYRTGERRFATVVGGSERVFVDDAGGLVVADGTLVPVSDARGAGFVNAVGDFSVWIPVVVDGSHPVCLEWSGVRVELVPVGGDFSRPVVRGSAVLFNEVWPGVDVQYSLVGGVLKEDVVLNRLVDRVWFGTGVRVFGGGVLVGVPGGLEVRDSVGGVLFGLSAPGV